MNTHQISNNIFKIEDPEACFCKVELFADTHKTLILNVLDASKNDQNIRLNFGRVAYYAGHIFWKGANFRFASESEYEQFIHEAGANYRGATDHVLYVVETADRTLCRIFALFGEKTDRNGHHPAALPTNTLG